MSRPLRCTHPSWHNTETWGSKGILQAGFRVEDSQAVAAGDLAAAGGVHGMCDPQV